MPLPARLSATNLFSDQIFSKALSGIASIRIYGLEDIFVHKLMDIIDNVNSAYFLTFANHRWLSVRLDLVGNILIVYRTLTLL